MSKQQRTELVKALEGAYQELEGLLAEAGEAGLSEPGVTGAWSIKDLIAHMTAWEARVAAWVEAIEAGAQPTPAPWPKDLSEEQVNAFIYENNRTRPLEEVLERWRQVHTTVLNAAKQMSDEALFERKIDWLGGQAFADALPGNSYEHQREHAQQIQAWLKANKKRIRS